MPAVAGVGWPAGVAGAARRAWSGWRFGTRSPEHVVIERLPHQVEAPADEELPNGTRVPGAIELTGRAEGCFACASHPGVVFRAAPNGEGHLPMPCPACESRRTPPGAQAP